MYDTLLLASNMINPKNVTDVYVNNRDYGPYNAIQHD